MRLGMIVFNRVFNCLFNSLANTAEKLLQAQLKLHAISAIHDVDNGTLVAKETENGVTRNRDDYELPDMNLLYYN